MALHFDPSWWQGFSRNRIKPFTHERELSLSYRLIYNTWVMPSFSNTFSFIYHQTTIMTFKIRKRDHISPILNSKVPWCSGSQVKALPVASPNSSKILACLFLLLISYVVTFFLFLDSIETFLPLVVNICSSFPFFSTSFLWFRNWIFLGQKQAFLVSTSLTIQLIFLITVWFFSKHFFFLINHGSFF